MPDLKELMDKTILKLETLKRSTFLNMQKLKVEHDGVLNAAKVNSTTENIEEPDKLRKILGKSDAMGIGEERGVLRGNIRPCNIVLMDRGKKQKKDQKP